jgi:hypothetical protein
MVYLSKEDGVVIADKDADGAISAAIITFLQNKKVFPVKQKVVLHILPVSPHGIEKFLTSFTGCPVYYAFLDLPYTDEIGLVLERIRRECPGTKIFYIDHHFSSIENIAIIRKYVDFYRISESKPTSMHLSDIASEKGVRLSEKLRLYARAIGYIELGKKPPSSMAKVVEMVASIARALKLEKSSDFWQKIVRWMSSSLPIPLSKSDMEVLDRVAEESVKKDKELEDAVTDLSISAQKLGCFRFIDARKKWKRKGVSSLATRLARKMRSPVALLAILKNQEILVIRTRNDAAKIIASELYDNGLVEDIAGHSNLSIVRLKKNYDFKKLKEILIRSCRYVR